MNMEDKMAKKKTNWEKVLTESWVSNRRSLTEEEAEKELVQAEFEIKQIVHEQKNNQQLQAAKEVVKDLNSGFGSAVKYEKAKIEFLLEHIENVRIANKAKVE
jgi:hypothetical protein